jgi:hypothetical protein
VATFTLRLSGQTNPFVVEAETQPECPDPYRTYDFRLVGGATLSAEGRLVESITPTKRQARQAKDPNVDYGLEKTLERLNAEQEEHYHGRRPRLTIKPRKE